VPVFDNKQVRRLRATAQALAGGVREATAEAVVRRVFAVQAQDATAADLGVRVRGHSISRDAVRTAYEDERSIVRGWYLRGTLHTVPSEDARWLLGLLAPKILTATARRYRQLGLDDRLRSRADNHIRRVLTIHGPLTRAELTGHLATLGLPPDRQVPFHLIRHAALNGILCHGPGDDYALLDDWLHAGPRLDEETALAELARRYLSAHAPATVEDFATWSGVPPRWARDAWKTLVHNGSITEQDKLTVLTGQTPDLGSSDPDVRLLPAYDNYLLGYRTRENSVPPAHQNRVWPGGGVIRPTVIADGLVIATWSRNAGRVQVDPFDPLPPQIQRAVDAEALAVITFLRP
jgi:hypothetical protein